jgi:hypothetical protein
LPRVARRTLGQRCRELPAAVLSLRRKLVAGTKAPQKKRERRPPKKSGNEGPRKNGTRAPKQKRARLPTRGFVPPAGGYPCPLRIGVQWLGLRARTALSHGNSGR